MQPAKEDRGIDRKRVAMLVLSIPMLAYFVFMVWHHVLPFLFPEKFIHDQPQELASPPPSSIAVKPKPDPDVAEESAGRALEQVYKVLSTPKVEASPREQIRLLTNLARAYPNTEAASRARERADAIRAKHRAELEAADRDAQAEVAALISSSRTRLEDLEHEAVAQELRALEERYAGLMAGARAGNERAAVEAAWSSLTWDERQARDLFRELADPGQDLDARLAVATRANEIAMRFPKARFGLKAAERRDALLEPFAVEVEKTCARDLAAGKALAQKLPRLLEPTPPGQRIVAARTRVEESSADVARKVVGQLRATRGRGDLDGARSIAKKLPAEVASVELQAVEVFARAARHRCAVPASPGFEVDRYEVTNAAYEVFVRETGASKPAAWTDGPPRDEEEKRGPVTGIALDEARAYARWIGARLPTADEWVLAAGGRRYPWGNEWKKDALNWCSSRFRGVGSYRAGESPCGAADLAGNAAEWTSTLDAKGRAAVKGGSRRDVTPESFEVGAVRWVDPRERDPLVGFRCVWEKGRK